MENPESENEKEKFIESLNTPEAVQENFKEAKEFIEDSAGIKLSNIELVGLRRITEKVMQEVYKQEKEHSKPGQPEYTTDFNHRTEILARFFLEFYDINPADLNKWYEILGEEKFQQFFRSKQEGKHLP